MNLNIIFKKTIYLMFVLGTLTSCEPDAPGAGNGLTVASVDPSFTITPVEGKNNTYLLVSGTDNVLNSYWKVGKAEFYGKMNLEIFLPDKGTYKVVHTAVGRGGTTDFATKEIIIAANDPDRGNLVKGTSFLDAADQAQWTNLHLNTNGLAAWTFTPGFATINASGNTSNQEGIYQEIDVVAGKEYIIDMQVSAKSGSPDFWFEVYAGKTVPTSGVVYTDNKVMGLSSEDGCGKGAFEGKLSAVGCVKNSATDKVGNVVKFAETGKVYLVIRAGGNGFTPTGITITEVEFRGK
ncbi:hypothetical protein [Flavobacterium sp. PL02]|jgi:hypothetical protein|uniref:hypothetical protein n=1 Tax=Flavobacterium sp. PL02 TaxID=3088354 RepID=UPI002B236E53|nr:hypothetical protein [Flavobacterium sp. PL02]MEA9415723.1 hypothetical protein [Flavobacterium sp. PL02]